MKILIVMVVMLLGSSGLISAQSLSIKDSTQIASIIEDWNRAWVNKDYVMASRWYSPDAKFTNAFGDQRKGQRDVEALLREVFELPFVMSGKTETTEHQYQVLDDNHVIVHSAVIRKGQHMPDGSLMPDRKTSHLRIFQKEKDGWKIKAHLISDARDKQNSKH